MTGLEYFAEKDLAASFPEKMRLWHPKLNGELTPQDVTAGSHKKVWWRCENGHDWQAKVYIVVNGCGCPY